MIRFAEFETPKRGAAIKVIGVGGCGNNAVDRMIDQHMPGVEFIACNTDTQALARNQATIKVQIGKNTCRGLGAGGDPERGREAIVEDLDEIKTVATGADMTFITAGMGGGTGTGAAPIIAGIVKELGSLTVGVVTKPFRFEGKKRMDQAEDGISQLKSHADTIIIIPNDKLITASKANTSIQDAFKMADEVLSQAVRGISDLITIPGYINLDFADVRKIMSNMGMCLMGTGMASGDERALQAVRAAISSPLLDDLSIEGAKGILINITGGPDLTLKEINEASTFIFEAADREANIIWGYVIDPEYEGKIKITVIATGFDSDHISGYKTTKVRDSIQELLNQRQKDNLSEDVGARPEPEPLVSKIKEPPVEKKIPDFTREPTELVSSEPVAHPAPPASTRSETPHAQLLDELEEEDTDLDEVDFDLAFGLKAHSENDEGDATPNDDFERSAPEPETAKPEEQSLISEKEALELKEREQKIIRERERQQEMEQERIRERERMRERERQWEQDRLKRAKALEEQEEEPEESVEESDSDYDEPEIPPRATLPVREPIRREAPAERIDTQPDIIPPKRSVPIVKHEQPAPPPPQPQPLPSYTPPVRKQTSSEETLPTYRKRKLIIVEPQTNERFGNAYFEKSIAPFPPCIQRVREDIPQPD